MTVTLKVKYNDFKSITRSMSVGTPITNDDIVMKYIRPMIDNTEAGSKKIRLLGISISNFVNNSCKMKEYKQLLPPFDDWEGSYE